MSEPRITEQAEADLADLWEYLAPKNREAADRLLDRILERARFHAQFPDMGRMRDDLHPGLRSFVVLPYVVFFRPVADTIEVIRVLHGARCGHDDEGGGPGGVKASLTLRKGNNHVPRHPACTEMEARIISIPVLI
jgi:toxin ParE1/3/4